MKTKKYGLFRRALSGLTVSTSLALVILLGIPAFFLLSLMNGIWTAADSILEKLDP